MSTATRPAQRRPAASAGSPRGAAAAGGTARRLQAGETARRLQAGETARPMQSHAIDGGVIVALRRLAALDRRPGGEGEAAAARLLRTELEHRGARAWIQEARVRRTHRGSLGLLSAAAALGSLGHRRTAIAAGVLAAALAADEPGLGAGPQRGPLRGRTAHSVIAEPGHAAGPETLVVCAHHDAAPTASGGGLGRARVRRLGGVLATASAAAMANIAPGRT